MHSDPVRIDIPAIVKSDRIVPESSLKTISWTLLFVGICAWSLGFIWYEKKVLWGIYYANTIFFLGLAFGGSMLPVIFQIVRAKWASPVRRLYECHAGFLLFGFLLLIGSYFGKDYLFPWATGPMPGREWWMQPNFAYARHLICLLALIGYILWFVRQSIRADIGFISEDPQAKSKWADWEYLSFIKGWKGSNIEIPEIQRRMSFHAPIIVFLYAVFMSLFAFEMIMGMDTMWFSNLFGAHIFISSIYIGWCGTGILVNYLRKKYPLLGAQIGSQQYWDMGKLTFAFCMLWGYFTFAQFLVQWYGNLPEETQWLILRTREYPWKSLAWLVFGACFVIPFITLMSEDVKKVPWLYGSVAIVPFLGLFMERYLLVMPQLSPTAIPFHGGLIVITVLTFLGFLGGYLICYFGFLSKYPYMTVSSPLAKNRVKWGVEGPNEYEVFD